MLVFLVAGGQRVQAELLHELHQDLLESRAEEGEGAEEGRGHQDGRVEGAVQSGAGRGTGRMKQPTCVYVCNSLSI